MKKAVLKILSAFVVLAAVLPCAVSPVFANSGKRYEYGVTGAGIVTLNKQSVIAVESERLVFDVPDFPDYYALSGYQSTVTAEYNFVNTSDSAVTSSMAFPIGIDPYIYGDAREPQIKVNGSAVEVQTRHTLGYYENFTDSVKYILDDYYSDSFYTPATEVTRYKITVDGVSGDDYRLVGDVTCGSGARFSAWNGTQNRITVYLNSGSNTFDLCVFGDTADFDCVWRFEKYRRHLFSSGEYVRTDVTFPISKTVEKTTLKDYVLSYRPEGSAVSEMDWYNAVVSDFGVSKYVPLHAVSGVADRYFLAWYTYDVQVEPNGRFTNTVTAPLLPEVNYGYDPDVYNYEYYLSPAVSWKSFGTLEIVINTDYYVTEQSLNLTEREGGYGATLNSLPTGELTFSLCSEQNPSYRRVDVYLGRFVVIVLIIVEVISVGLVVFAIVYLVKSRKK